jgi:hypothetical protein
VSTISPDTGSHATSCAANVSSAASPDVADTSTAFSPSPSPVPPAQRQLHFSPGRRVDLCEGTPSPSSKADGLLASKHVLVDEQMTPSPVLKFEVRRGRRNTPTPHQPRLRLDCLRKKAAELHVRHSPRRAQSPNRSQVIAPSPRCSAEA